MSFWIIKVSFTLCSRPLMISWPHKSISCCWLYWTWHDYILLINYYWNVPTTTAIPAQCLYFMDNSVTMGDVHVHDVMLLSCSWCHVIVMWSSWLPVIPSMMTPSAQLTSQYPIQGQCLLWPSCDIPDTSQTFLRLPAIVINLKYWGWPITKPGTYYYCMEGYECPVPEWIQNSVYLGLVYWAFLSRYILIKITK